jgi:hypothetical protein
VLRFTTGENIDPTFHFDGSWFYLSSHNDVMKRSIDSRTSNSNITSLKDFQKVTKGFPSKLNSLGYIDVQTFLQVYGKAASQMTNANPGAAVYAGYERELEYLAKDLFGSGSYSRIQRNGRFSESYSSVPNAIFGVLPLLPQLPEMIRRYQGRENFSE